MAQTKKRQCKGAREVEGRERAVEEARGTMKRGRELKRGNAFLFLIAKKGGQRHKVKTRPEGSTLR